LHNWLLPFAPYLSEELFINLTGKESVHLTDYPLSHQEVIDLELENRMQVVIDLVSLGRAARNACQIKIRQPLEKMYLPAKYKDIVESMRELILEEVNIHNLVYVSEEDDFVQYEVKPQFKIMGPKYGKQMKAITEALSKLKGQEVLSAFNSSGVYHLTDLGIDLVPEDVVVQIIPRESFVFESMNDKFVALDTTLTPDLLQEGYARELVNKIQFTRKEHDFDILDRIVVEWYGDDDIQAAIDKYNDYIKKETLCDELRRVNSSQNMQVYDINGKEVYLKIYKVENK